MNVIIGVDPHKASHTAVAMGRDEDQIASVKAERRAGQATYSMSSISTRLALARDTKTTAGTRSDAPAHDEQLSEPSPRQRLPRHALGSWLEFDKIAPHSSVGCMYASPSSWTRYSHRVLGALPKSLSEKFTGPNSPFAL
jgi:hypothetical protein